MCEQMGLDRLPLGCVDLEQGASSFRAILSYTLLFYLLLDSASL